MNEIRESLIKGNKDLESLKNSDAPEREIDIVKAKIRTLEAENVKTRSKSKKKPTGRKKVN